MRRKQLLLIGLLVPALLPYFIICFYALPFADDFCFAWTSLEKISFTQRLLRQYLNFCGRYSADALLCVHPLASGHIIYAQLTLFASLLATYLGLVLLLRFFVTGLLKAFLAALFILLFYLCYMPQLAEGVYWYTGWCNYGVGLLLILFHVVLVLFSSRFKTAGRVICLVCSAVLLVAAIGVHELNATLMPAAYLLAVIVLYAHKSTSPDYKRNFQIATVFFVIAITSAGFEIFAPGNFIRTAVFDERFNFTHSLFYSLLQTARFTVSWIFTLPALILSACVMACSPGLPDTRWLRFNYITIFALVFFTVFMGSFLPYFGTGILGQHRTINYVFFLFIILWLWFLVSLSKSYSLHLKLLPLIGDNRWFALAIICIVCMAFTGNGGRIVSDFRNGNFINYKTEFMERQARILQQPGQPITPLKNIPQSFTIVDARYDSTWWVNKCMKFFYRDTRLQLK